MALRPILCFPDPRLHKVAQAVSVVDGRIQTLVADMFETMYANKGVGLAAQQVGKPLQLTVIDVRGAVDRPSTLDLGDATITLGEAS